jgi:hypothetical protein
MAHEAVAAREESVFMYADSVAVDAGLDMQLATIGNGYSTG